VARDRKRAKQRQQRRGASGGGTRLARADLPGALEHVDVPGALDHASADADEFDAALVRGAGGEPAEAEALAEPQAQDLAEPDGNGAATGRVQLPAQQAPARQPLPTRAAAFVRASWAELQRVQWPDRRQVSQATAVVLGFVAVAGVYFGVADYVAKEIVEAIL
jgi:preprotein translocase subunit SecE